MGQGTAAPITPFHCHFRGSLSTRAPWWELSGFRDKESSRRLPSH